jgi:hypothetical protein
MNIFLTSALVGVARFMPRQLYPGERAPGTHCIGSSVDPRAGLDAVEKRKFLILPGLGLRPLCHPARRQSLYRLRYPGSLVKKKELIICAQFLYRTNTQKRHMYHVPQISLLKLRVGHFLWRGIYGAHQDKWNMKRNNGAVIAGMLWEGGKAPHFN